MANWIKKTNLVEAIPSSFKELGEAIKTIDSVIQVIDTINSVIQSQASVISTLTIETSLANASRATLQELKTTLNAYISNFLSGGFYLLPIFPTGIFQTDAYDSIKGGILGFKNRIQDSIYDPYDQNRPPLDSNYYVAALVVAIDSGNAIETLTQSLAALSKLFNLGFDISKSLAKPINVTATFGDKTILLNWNIDIGFTPNYFLIERQMGTIWVDDATTKTFNVINTGGNLQFFDNNLENNIPYVYRITPVAYDIPGTPVLINSTPRSFQGQGNFDATGIKACSNLGYRVEGSGRLRYCTVSNSIFTLPGNNGIQCNNGSVLCPQYTNKNCKYNDGIKCTSTGTSIHKSRTIDSSMNIVPVPNKDLWHVGYCQSGRNGAICDGYTDKTNPRFGTPPNWTSLTFKTFFPREIGVVLDGMNGFVNSMFAMTAKAEDAVQVFSNLLGDTAKSYTSILTEFRNLLQDLNTMFNVNVPGAYVLTIPPALGGTTYFLDTLFNATNPPSPNPYGYTAGFVILFEGEKDLVQVGYQLWRSLFGV